MEVLETVRGGIIRSGLGYDLAFVKSLVVEAVKPSGYAVLNADDNMTDHILPKVRCKIILFARNRANELLENHIYKGGMAVVAEDGREEQQVKWPIFFILVQSAQAPNQKTLKLSRQKRML